jgi:hypothetical protein
MLSYPPGADDAAIRAAPRVGDGEVLVSDATQRPVSDLTVFVPFILVLNNVASEDQSGDAKIDAVIFDVAPPLAFIPFEAIHGSRYTFVST